MDLTSPEEIMLNELVDWSVTLLTFLRTLTQFLPKQLKDSFGFTVWGMQSMKAGEAWGYKHKVALCPCSRNRERCMLELLSLSYPTLSI
jgi:hypothetical protein